MTELLTAAQMRAIEQAAIDSGEVTGLELVERAGRGVVEAIFEEWPELESEDATGQGGAAPDPASGLRPFIGRNDPPDHFQEALEPQDISGKRKRAVVLCGPGNNGGDGFVVARLLHERGWEVEVFLYGDADKLPPDARVNYERWCELGVTGKLVEYSRKDGWKCDVLIDALFGTGLTRPLTELGDLFWNMEDMVDCFGIEFGHSRGRPAIVAVDMPSGICSDSGKEFPHEEDWNRFAATAHLTVSFHRCKLGHFLGEGVERAGKLRCVDIGLESRHKNLGWVETTSPQNAEGKDAPVWKIAKRALVRQFDGLHGSWVRKDIDHHKYSHGHALILTGGFGKTGAARLAGRGALRIGAGLVTLGVPPSARMEVASHITAIMQTRVSEGQELATLLQDARLNALCLGPGMGVERARELVPVALLAKRATVLDADALTAFADDPQALFDQLHDSCVLTPHGGEFARLFPDIAEKLNAPAAKGPAYSKVDATREAAARAGCVVLFKGSDTVIAAPDGQCSIHSAEYERAAPWLATAGSGDVLAGFITGLLARGFSPMQAAETAAWLHVECALEFGPGLIAEDLPEMLPKVFRKIGA